MTSPYYSYILSLKLLISIHTTITKSWVKLIVFQFMRMPLGKAWIHHFSRYRYFVGQTELFSPGEAASRVEETKKLRIQNWGMMFGESVTQCCSLLLLSVHPKDVACPVQVFILIDQTNPLCRLFAKLCLS